MGLRSDTGDSLVPEGIPTRISEVFTAPMFQLDDVVIRLGRKIHGERNKGEPCTVVFVVIYSKPYHYTVRDPFGKEIGVTKSYLKPCREVMKLADRRNAKPCAYEAQMRFP